MSKFNLHDSARAIELARDYVSKIGRAGHFAGKLHAVRVTTEITHQRNAGDTNYWKDDKFDAALARVVRSHFLDLSNEALALMQAEFDQERVAQKERLLAELLEIEKIECAARGTA